MRIDEYEKLEEEEKKAALKKCGRLRVYQYMKDFGAITSLQAIYDLGVHRLSGIIYVLKNEDGINIESEEIAVKNRYGNVSHVSKYRIA